MDAIVLTRLRRATPAPMLEERVHIVRHLDLAALFAHQLLHALASGVAEILREQRRLDAFRLDREEARSEEHTSELQSRGHLVCRLLLEKKKKKKDITKIERK